MTDQDQIISMMETYLEYDSQQLDLNRIKNLVLDGLRDIKLPSTYFIKLHQEFEVDPNSHQVTLPKNFQAIESFWSNKSTEYNNAKLVGNKLKLPSDSAEKVYISYSYFPIDEDDNVIFPAMGDLEQCLLYWVISKLMLAGYRPKDPTFSRQEAERNYAIYKSAVRGNLMFHNWSQAYRHYRDHFNI